MRIHLQRGRVGLEPAAVVDHDYEFDRGALKWRWLERNRWAFLIRVYPAPLLVLLLPALFATEGAIFVTAARGGWLREKLLASLDVLRWLPRLARERRAVQVRRAAGAREFADWLTADLDSPFIAGFARTGAVRAGLRLYWRLVRAFLR
jgi:hypothetical protein